VQFFPNWKLDEQTLRSSRRGTSILRSSLEAMIPDRIASSLDRWLMKRWQRIWQTRYAHLSDDERSRKFHCSEYLSTAYGQDYQEVILDSFRDRLREHRLN
jgi:hypothetical protein